MAATSKAGPAAEDIIIREAIESDIPSLTTIFARSFHPSNAFMKHCWPDVEPVRQWWARTLAGAIRHPDAHPIIAFDTTTNTVAGLCSIRLLHPEDGGAGVWDTTTNPFIPEIDSEMFRPALDAMVEGRNKAFPPGPGNVANFLVELLGVDESYKGYGLGRKLLERVGEVVDKLGAPAFVEANAKAKAFYEKFGFVEQGSMEMPGVDGKPYVEHLLVRSARKNSH